MSAAIAPIPPDVFKQMLLKDGFGVERETASNWTLLNEKALRPVIVIPKEGDVLSLAIMMEILHQLKMDNGKFFKLLKQVQH